MKLISKFKFLIMKLISKLNFGKLISNLKFDISH